MNYLELLNCRYNYEKLKFPFTISSVFEEKCTYELIIFNSAVKFSLINQLNSLRLLAWAQIRNVCVPTDRSSLTTVPALLHTWVSVSFANPFFKIFRPASLKYFAYETKTSVPKHISEHLIEIPIFLLTVSMGKVFLQGKR